MFGYKKNQIIKYFSKPTIFPFFNAFCGINNQAYAF